MRQIILSNDVPISGHGILISYKSELVKAKDWDIIDIRDVINENKDQWLNDIHNWHGKILETFNKVTDFLPLLPVSRIILWETTNKFSLKPLLFFF